MSLQKDVEAIKSELGFDTPRTPQLMHERISELFSRVRELETTVYGPVNETKGEAVACTPFPTIGLNDPYKRG
jgi:hypothetical protein